MYNYTDTGIETVSPTSGFTSPTQNVGTVNEGGHVAGEPVSPFISSWPSFPYAVKVIGTKFAMGSTTTPEGSTSSTTESAPATSPQGIDIANVFISYVDLLFIAVLFVIAILWARRK